MYKVLFGKDINESSASDTLAAIDQATEDGVDLMSLSLAFNETIYSHNPISLGAFAAMEKGIFVACSAGNNGLSAYSIFNGALWITTVGAGSIDRDYAALVTLGEGIATFKGKSVYPENLFISGVPFYYGQGDESKEICDHQSLDPEDVSGKIVFCTFANDSNPHDQRIEVSRAGAAGAIFATNTPQSLVPKEFSFPFVAISPNDVEKVKEYFGSTNQPTADIKFQITILGVKSAPRVANFSSRGPAPHSPWILKPVIMAQGVHVLAAWVHPCPHLTW